MGTDERKTSDHAEDADRDELDDLDESEQKTEDVRGGARRSPRSSIEGDLTG